MRFLFRKKSNLFPLRRFRFNKPLFVGSTRLRGEPKLADKRRVLKIIDISTAKRSLRKSIHTENTHKSGRTV